MKKLFIALCVLSGGAVMYGQSDSIPSRAVVVSGDASHPDHAGNIIEMYSRANMAFEDPAAPRFLFLDKQGSVALGIGGQVKAVGEYDLCGAVDDADFVTNEIPVPFNPALRQRLGATAAHSSLFLKLVTRRTRVGRVVVYMQTNFTGDGGHYGLALKQAYVKVGNVTLGKARSTFADGPAMAPTIDDQGPSGQTTAKNIMIQYSSPSYRGFSYAASVEMPSADYTLGANTADMQQRFPDIPAYVQYAWDKGDSHIRVSGILRQLSYRDLAGNGSNHFVTGWGVQMSTISNIYGGLKFFGHYTYGKGIANYINDLDGLGYNLIPEGNGKLKAPASIGYTAGLEYDFSSKFFVTASYSQARLYNTSGMAPDTYRYGQYIVANAFYNLLGDLTIGVEYLHGNRKDISGHGGHANRLEAMVQYSF